MSIYYINQSEKIKILSDDKLVNEFLNSDLVFYYGKVLVENIGKMEFKNQNDFKFVYKKENYETVIFYYDIGETEWIAIMIVEKIGKSEMRFYIRKLDNIRFSYLATAVNSPGLVTQGEFKNKFMINNFLLNNSLKASLISSYIGDPIKLKIYSDISLFLGLDLVSTFIFDHYNNKDMFIKLDDNEEYFQGSIHCPKCNSVFELYKVGNKKIIRDSLIFVAYETEDDYFCMFCNNNRKVWKV